MKSSQCVIFLLAFFLLSATLSSVCFNDTWRPVNISSPGLARTLPFSVWTGTEMIIWGGHDGFRVVNTGAIYNPSTNAWRPMNTNHAPAPRLAANNPVAVWTGSKMIVWGGTNGMTAFNSGGIYDPVTNQWTATSLTDGPAKRLAHSIIWTGTEMIVWGGYDGAGTYYNDGGLYNPVTNVWRQTSTLDAPGARREHSAVWTGTHMIIWGGDLAEGQVNTGGRYNPVTNSWQSTNRIDRDTPSARTNPIAVWTGNQMLVWGGYDYTTRLVLNTGARYNPASDSWTSMSAAPTYRYGIPPIWTGNEMIIWGGQIAAGGEGKNTGARYNPINDSWHNTSTINAPSPRMGFAAVWTGHEMIVWGGNNNAKPFGDGGRYCASSAAIANHNLN